MLYMGYEIKHVGGHYQVTAPDGTTWTEDTVEDAKIEIREEIMVQK